MSEEPETANNDDDESEVLDEDFLLRRIPLTPNFIKPDGSITSMAFKPSPKDLNGLSVNLKAKSSYDETVLDKEKYTVVQVKAKFPREKELTIVPDPCPPEEPENEAHALIKGLIRGDKASNKKAKFISRNASLLEDDD